MTQRESSPPPPSFVGETSLAVTCNVCGAEAAVVQRFCGSCGAKLVLVCKACGTENPLNHSFCGGCGAKLERTPEGVGVKGRAEPVTNLREERRWVTVVFADLSGFTTLSEQLDPEDVKALAHDCTQRLSEEILRFGGTV